jgi:hypothetical protein
MRLPSLRLLSSSKGARISEAAKIREAAETPESATTSDGPNREKWHQEVRNSRNVLEFLVTGHPPIEPIHLESLKGSTVEYLRVWETNHVRPSTECDKILGALIDEHARRDCLTGDVAILACLYALSIPAAVRHLVSLMDLDVERYLRCITLVGQANPCVVSGEELRSAQSLLRILSGQGQDFQEFQHVIEALGLGAPMIFIPLKIIQSVLARSGIRSRLQRQLDSHLEQKRFMSAFLLVSWLQCVSRISNNNIIAVLDGHFPSWPWLIAWRPKIDRIGRWERGKFTDMQRKKLSHAFDLDGPDTATHRCESLKMAEPQCYEHVHVHPQSTETLERFLDLLYRAHILGPGALELFIYLCIDNSADETALSMVDDGIKTGEDSYCSRLLVILRALSPQSSLSRQMSDLTQALTILNDRNALENVHPSTDHLADRLSGVMKAAQVAFCAQLEKGMGEYMGMLIYDLGNAILQASWIHSNLPSDFLAQIRQFPPQDALEAILDQLQDSTESSSSRDSRFKSYLASALGGRGEAEAGSMTLAAIREEVQFWKHPPDTFRKDLARTFAKVRSMDYSLYTSCLLVMLKEDDLFICEMRHMITLENEQTCLNFAKYLARRRRLNQLRHECWLLLLVSLIREQVPSFLPRIADSMPCDQWLKLVDDLTHLVAPVSSRLPQSGTGLTRERLSWWETLSQNMTAIRFLLRRQGEWGRVTWLYFPSHLSNIVDLLDIVRQEQSMMPIQRQIVSYLAPDGNNVASVCDCIREIKQTSIIGRAVCERMLSRKEMVGREEWPEPGLDIVLEAWRRSGSLTQVDKSVLDLIRRLLKFPVRPQLHTAGSRSACERLQSEYNTLLHHARKLETLRLRLRHQRPQRISALLQRLGVDNTSSGRAADAEISGELVDAVESVGEAEYELSFALTGLSNLQRQARGISKDSRILLVRLCLQESPQFCIHFSPNDEGRGQHNYLRPADNHEPGSTICTKRSNLFTYYLGRHLHQLLRRGHFSLQSIHSAILKLITASPATCLVCSGSMSIKLWKPAACSKDCSFKLRNAPLEVRLHNLLVDTLSIDLLLTCVYAAAADQSNLKLLPGCPVQKTNIKAVIDSFPPLASLETATDLQAAIRGDDGYGKDREKLLSWLCLKFRGFMLTAPDGFRVPSMPNTKQFLILNSNHEREQLFNAQLGSQGVGGTVFHGTRVSRLFLILTEGLKSMSNTTLMLHGTTMGVGIYCGDNQGTSLPYAGTTGQSWRNSALKDMRIMLGCELAGYGAPYSGSVHVVADQNRLLVRYVFLLPQAYQHPPRHHVEPAMRTAFANLRSGLLA